MKCIRIGKPSTAEPSRSGAGPQERSVHRTPAFGRVSGHRRGPCRPLASSPRRDCRRSSHAQTRYTIGNSVSRHGPAMRRRAGAAADAFGRLPETDRLESARGAPLCGVAKSHSFVVTAPKTMSANASCSRWDGAERFPAQMVRILDAHPRSSAPNRLLLTLLTIAERRFI